jgi:hypothetical protein
MVKRLKSQQGENIHAGISAGVSNKRVTSKIGMAIPTRIYTDLSFLSFKRLFTVTEQSTQN